MTAVGHDRLRRGVQRDLERRPSRQAALGERDDVRHGRKDHRHVGRRAVDRDGARVRGRRVAGTPLTAKPSKTNRTK